MKGLLSRSRLPVLDEAGVAPSALGPAFVPTLPPSLKSYVHLEHVGDQWEIRVAAGHEFDAGFLTWLGDLDHHGVAYVRECVDLDNLVNRQGRERMSSADLDVSPPMREAVIRFFELADAAGASDVHWHLGRDTLQTLVRIDGDRYVVGAWSKTAADGQQVLRAVMELAHNKPTEYKTQEFQNGTIDGRKIPGSALENIRVNRGPADPAAFGGQYMVCRLQPDVHASARRRVDPATAARLLDLRVPPRPSERLRGASQRNNEPAGAPKSRFEVARDVLAAAGLDERQIDLAVRILAGKGLVITTGPTGSGKSTLQHALMTYKAELDPTKAQISIEDPPEKPLAWAVTLAVTPDHPFDLLQKETLRMDPNIVQIGEARDFVTTMAGFTAARSGRLTFETMHVDDPLEVFDRMRDFDFERLSPRVTCNHRLITGIIGRRLFPLLCEKCRVPLAFAGGDALPGYLREDLRAWGTLNQVHLKGPGCDACHRKGITGRVTVTEVIRTDAALMRDLRELSLADAAQRHRARKDTDRAMIHRAIDYVLAGKVDPFELGEHLTLERPDDVYGPGVYGSDGIALKGDDQ
ncbi:ATPase, T2SS/T4P/T4SS family [Burkholderia gladioli]|uniref:ATPase, T2SS/T4P/T4SS family n=1 Tax=Burkholderia gladioli TaxID=28095 RepID=UPI0016405117|nr:ATPase, T2SS/T4P/T4SS family [Burkholderia gladioli]